MTAGVMSTDEVFLGPDSPAGVVLVSHDGAKACHE